MLQIDRMPEELIKQLESRGITSDSILLCAKTDISPEHVYCDNWLIATKDDLIVVSGVKTLLPKNMTPAQRFLHPERLQCDFTEIGYQYYPIRTIFDLKLESLISDARLTAKQKENEEDTGAFVLLSYLSGTAKNSANLFVKYFNQIKEKGEVTPNEDDFNKEIFCPKCGRRYPDPNRKICPHCMDKGKIIKRMSGFFLKYKFGILTIFIIMVLSAVLSVITPYFSNGFFYDEILSETGAYFGNILLVLMIIIGTRVINIFFSMISSTISAKITANVVYDLKKTIFSSIERLSLSFFTGRQTGGLMTQVNSDATSIYWFFVDGLQHFVINVMTIIVIVILMFIMNPLLAFLSLITLPLFVWSFKLIFAKLDKLHAKRFSSRRSMNAQLSDVLTGVRVVKAFSKEKAEISRFHAKSERAAFDDRSLTTFETWAFPSVDMLL